MITSNNIKSEIGQVVNLLYLDKTNISPLDKKERFKLQKQLSNLINIQPICIENNTAPGIYNSDGTLQKYPIPYEIEILGWTEEKFRFNYPFYVFN